MDKPTGRQIAAARALTGLTQGDLALRSQISVPTLKRMEASAGVVVGMANNVDAVVRALEAAGVEFTNGGQPGVRMKIFADAGQRAELLHGDRTVPCYTLQEAVLAWRRLSPEDQKAATIKLASGVSYVSDEIDRLYHAAKPPA